MPVLTLTTRHFIGSQYIFRLLEASVIKVTFKKIKLMGRNYQAYGTIFYIICEKKNHAILNDIDSKRSSSRCFQGHNLHHRGGLSACI